MRGVPRAVTDRHAAAATVPPDQRAVRRLYNEADEIEFWCCAAELVNGRCQHDRSCPTRRRPA